MTSLQIGSSGPSAALLQLALRRAGVYGGELDGIFGEATASAVAEFQKNNGLRSDGVVGPRTHRALMPWYLGYTVHTAARGDTIYKIAARHGSSVRAIETANPGLDALNIPVGSALTVPLGFELVPDGLDWCSALVGYCVRGLAARYPFLALDEFGKSTMGRPLYSLCLGGGERRLFYSAAFHANEWITAPLLLKYIEELSSAYSRGAELCGVPARAIFEKCRICFAPCVNPDGMDLVTGEIKSGAFYRAASVIAENYPDIPFPSGWKANIAGVDLNLQFPAEWEKARILKFAQGYVSPAPRDYVGLAPLSARESRAVYDYTNAIDPELILAYHTQGEVIYWQYLDYEPKNSLEIGEALSKASGYALESTPYASGFAGYKDWFISEFDRPGYTVEAGLGENPLPISQFGEIYAKNRCLMTAAAAAML